MQKSAILNQLHQALESIQNQLNRIEKDEYQLHKLDVHLLLDKTRTLYDLMAELEISVQNKSEKNSMAVAESATPVVNDNIPVEEKGNTNSSELLENDVHEEENISVVDSEPVFESDKSEELTRKEEINEQMTEVEIQLVVPDVLVVESPLNAQPVQEEKTTDNIPVRSNFDLFSATAEKTISDKLSQERQQTLADKMRQSRISDLRQAIGINEKFLFINELFKGDLGKYNKAIDELNEMTTKEGISTFFIELKIINQWNEENIAFTKLKEIIDRKFE